MEKSSWINDPNAVFPNIGRGRKERKIPQGIYVCIYRFKRFFLNPFGFFLLITKNGYYVISI